MNSALFISAFYDIGRHTWNDNFKCTPDAYTKYIDQMMSLSQNFCIYLDGSVYDKYKAKYGDSIQPYNSQDTLIPWSIEHESRIMQSQEYQDLLKHRLHHPEHSRPMYNAVNHNKVHFLKRAAQERPEFTHYIWIDIHYLRHNDLPCFIETQVHDKILIGSSKYPESLKGLSQTDIVTSTYDHLQGSVYIVPSKLVTTLYDLYTKQLELNYKVNIADDDQGIHLNIYQNNPDLYQILYTAKFGNFFKVYEPVIRELAPLNLLWSSSINLQEKTILCNIMTAEKSDKGNGWHNYTVLYHALLNGLRDKPIKVFEMGLGSTNPDIPSNMGINGRPGASLFGWSKYFTHDEAICWGADIDATIKIDAPKIKTFASDQLSAAKMHQMWAQPLLKNTLFDVIIDDGLHTFYANMNMLENSLYKLKAGGLYIIEDIPKKELHLFKDYIQKLEVFLPGSTIMLADIPNANNMHDNVLMFIQKRFKSSFSEVFAKYTTIFRQMNEIMEKTINQWRGVGSYLINGQNLNYEPLMKPKQELLFEYAKNKKSALEIGVHGAHSLLIMLMANPELQIDAIDLCLWEHTEKCVQYLNYYFGNRINLIKGDSLQMLHSLEKSRTYDLVHIDGDHDIEYVKKELESLQSKISKHATIIFDDIDAPNVLDYLINNNNLIVVEIPDCKWNNCVTIYKGL